MQRFLREPLLQFMLLGALIFAVDAWLSRYQPASQDDLYHIRVTGQHLDALRAGFHSEQGRYPNESELRARLAHWLDEQMLYRQARALGLDQGDAIVRRQLIQKMRFLLEDAEPVENPGESTLQAWLAAHPARYTQGQRYDFDQVFLSRGVRGDALDRDAVALLHQLQNKQQDYLGQGDPATAGQSFAGVSAEQLRREFGAGFADQLQAAPIHQWHGPISSGLGLHLVRVHGVNADRTARLDAVRERVLSDWRAAQREQATTRAMQQLRRQFRVAYPDTLDEKAG